MIELAKLPSQKFIYPFFFTSKTPIKRKNFSPKIFLWSTINIITQERKEGLKKYKTKLSSVITNISMRRPSTNSKQRIATVSVRKEGDATDRFQMKVPLSVADSENGNGGLGKRSENLIWTRINRNLIRTTISKNGYLKVDVSLGSTRKSYHSGNQSSARYSGYDDTRSFYVNGILLATDGSTRQYRELIPVKKGDVIEMTNTAKAYSQGWCTGRMHGWNMGPFYQQGCYNGHWTNQGPNPYGSSVLIY